MRQKRKTTKPPLSCRAPEQTPEEHGKGTLWYPHRMPEYVIEREVPGAGKLTEQEIQAISRQSLEVIAGIGPQIQWLHSYVTDDKIYCVYLAPDETPIREHAKRLGVPANRISAVRRMIDPGKYS